VPATSSAASPGNQATRPGAGHAGDATGNAPVGQSVTIGTGAAAGTAPQTGTARVKRGMADML
jgi:hypothetical protein